MHYSKLSELVQHTSVPSDIDRLDGCAISGMHCASVDDFKHMKT